MSEFAGQRKKYLAAITILAMVLLSAIAITRPPELFGKFRSFSSYYELRSFVLQRAKDYDSYLGGVYGLSGVVPSPFATFQSANSANKFTTTNVQVEGVDEPDIVKTDGHYLYIVSQNKVFIILAYPPDQLRIVSRLDYSGTVEGIFLSEDRLAVIETGYPNAQDAYYGPATILSIYDISDRSNPQIVKTISVQGNYINSRLTAGYIYAIIQQAAVQYDGPGSLRVLLPTIQKNGAVELLSPSKVYYNPSSTGLVNTYTVAIAVRITDGFSNEVSLLTGFGSTIYASLSNIYVTFPENPVIYFPQGVMSVPSGFAPSIWSGYGADTTIFRIAISGGEVNLAAAGSVPGGILNQFSMDEYNGYFRVATTSFRPEFSGGSVQVNNVYVLDQTLKIVGSIEGLASKEKIYAVRFMANRGYVVTFEKVDPLFAISLDDPTQPKLLNELTMPGFSQYLHPIGNGYLIGVGKGAAQAEQGEFAWYQGLKLSLFHADDNGNLTEVAKFLIGDRGSDSPVLYEHKAFMYDSERKIMALPVMVAQVNKNSYGGTPPPNTYGDPVWQGAYIFQVSSQGFKPMGNITHIAPGQPITQSYPLFVNRVLINGDFVYTISDTMLEINSITNFANVAEIQLQAAASS